MSAEIDAPDPDPVATSEAPASRKVTQTVIAEAAGLDVSSVNKILRGTHGARFRRGVVDRVFRVAREMGFDFARLKHFHRRRGERYPASLHLDLTVYLQGGVPYDAGRAVMEDVSATGALIRHLSLGRGGFPVEPFRVGLWLEPGRMEVRGRIVRVGESGGWGFGIEFDPPAPPLDLLLKGGERRPSPRKKE